MNVEKMLKAAGAADRGGWEAVRRKRSDVSYRAKTIAETVLGKM